MKINNIDKIPLVILAGGFGTRISEETTKIPKPMVEIGGIPIILHIMNYYSKFGVNEFIICAGYKANILKEYFYSLTYSQSDLEFNLKDKKISFLTKNKKQWKIKIIDTGINTMTGGRIKKILKYIKSENFFMTYGDGLSNVNINSLYKLHLKHKKIATVTAVKPTSRFGYLKINKYNLVKKFEEKPINDDWINGGFFILNKKIYKYIKNSKTIFEKEPLEFLSQKKQLIAFKHKGFWQPMDTLRDKKVLEKIWMSKTVPWL